MYLERLHRHVLERWVHPRDPLVSPLDMLLGQESQNLVHLTGVQQLQLLGIADQYSSGVCVQPLLGKVGPVRAETVPLLVRRQTLKTDGIKNVI